MKMKNLNAFIKDIIKENTPPEGVIVDLTCGNGCDTLFLCQNFKNSQIYAIDIQEKAIKTTKEKCQHWKNDIIYICDDHQNIDKYVQKKIDLAIYNTGYLPKGDKNIQTNPEKVLNSLQKVLTNLNEEGLAILTVYKGHDEGKEYEQIKNYLQTIDKYNFIVFNYKTVNTNNSPEVYIIEKKVKNEIL